MGKKHTDLRPIVRIAALSGLVLLLALTLTACAVETPSVSYSESPPQSSPITTKGLALQDEIPATPYPIPQALDTPTSPAYPLPSLPTSLPYPPTPGKVRALIEKGALHGGVTAVTLDTGRMWLVPPDGQPAPLGEYGDVAAIYGWNHDGTKILFGRGVYKTPAELAPTTQLWVYEMGSGQTYRLTDSTRVWSAAWSPVEDKVAYCEYSEPTSVVVVSVQGEILQRQEDLMGGMSWSPNGSAIAAAYVGPERVVYGEKYPVLGIWWLEKDEVQLLSYATREDHAYPIWMIDGQHVVFHRSIAQSDDEDVGGLYIADIETGEMSLYPNNPELYASALIRSPKSDAFLFQSGGIHWMEYGKPPVFIDKGSKPAWHPDGKTMVYYDQEDQIQIADLNIDVRDQAVGGYFNTHTLIGQPDIFFFAHQ